MTRDSGTEFQVVTLVPGSAAGPLLYLDEPLSFWGGVHPEEGIIVDSHHPQYGQSVVGRVVCMSKSRGSSSSSSVLAELLRLGTGPAAMVLSEFDSILMLGSLVAFELYQNICPIVVMTTDDLKHHTNAWTEVNMHDQDQLIVQADRIEVQGG